MSVVIEEVRTCTDGGKHARMGVRRSPAPPPFALSGFGWQATRRPTGRRVSPEAPSGAQGDHCHLWYVYFLELSKGDIYVGSTDDLRRRFASHAARTCRLDKQV